MRFDRPPRSPAAGEGLWLSGRPSRGAGRGRSFCLSRPICSLLTSLVEILRPAACWFRFRRRQLLRILLLRGLKVAGIDRYRLDRRCLVRLRGNDECGGYAVKNRERQSLDHFLIGHDLIVSRPQDPVDRFQPERMAEDDSLTLRTCGRRSYTAARRTSGNSALS
jgi:hypothetical protein